MPLYKIDKQNLQEIKAITFNEAQLKERKDLQALLRDNPACIDPDLLIISEEYTNWQESLRRVDLLALERKKDDEAEGGVNLVVIELKAVEDGGHMELQAIRYAAMLSNMDFRGVVDAYQKFLDKPGKPKEDARKKVLEFLGVDSEEEITVSQVPKMILMSPSFSRELTTAVLWLNERGLDIRCIEVCPHKIDGNLYLDVEQVIPLPAASDYIVQRRQKEKHAEIQAALSRRPRTIPLLFEKGVLRGGAKIHLIKLPRAGLALSDEKMKHATFQDDQSVVWEFDGNNYSLSGLCRAICEKFGGNVGAGAFAGPDYWAIAGEEVSLTDRAKLATEKTSGPPSASGICAS